MKASLSPANEGDVSDQSTMNKQFLHQNSRINVTNDATQNNPFNRNPKKNVFNMKSYQIKKDANAQMNQGTSMFESKIDDMKSPKAEQFQQINNEQNFEITNSKIIYR